MWTKFFLKYWRFLAIAGIVVISLVTFTILKNRYETRIRSDERTACNAEWSAKEAERQKLVSEAEEKAQSTKKTIKSNYRPAGYNDLIRVYRAGSFSQPVK